MSNKSRARHVLYADDAPDPDEVAEAEAQTDRMSRVADAFATPGRKGLDKLVRLVMDDRDEALAKPDVEEPTEGDKAVELVAGAPPLYAPPVRQPTAYESAALMALGDNTYAGTVEPWRVDARRRRNRAARKTRQRQRRRAAGRSVGAL